MCDECVKLDKKIEHYRRLVAQGLDPLTVERVDQLIGTMEAQKLAFHPEQKQ